MIHYISIVFFRDFIDTMSLRVREKFEIKIIGDQKHPFLI